MGNHNIKDSIKATYYIETTRDLGQVAEELVVLETSAKWGGEEAPTSLYEESVGEVHRVDELEKGRGTIELLYPIMNFDLESSAFSCLWLSMIGGPTFALSAYDKSRLVDFQLPPEMEARFKGPAYGIEKTRELLNKPGQELMLGTIMKPTGGLTPEQVAARAYEAAIGGVCFIKDDEKMMNPAYCPLGQRVKKVSEALKRAEDQTGQKVLYAAHISTGPDSLIDYAKLALDNGASALMVNFFAAGFSAIQRLREHPDFGVPIYAHCGGREAMGRALGQGISPSVVVKFVRMLGGDYFRAGMLESYLIDTRDDISQMHDAAKGDWCPYLPILPAVSGGLNSETIEANVSELGVDNLFLAGSGVFNDRAGAGPALSQIRERAVACLAS